MVPVVLGKEFHSFSVLGERGTLSRIFRTPGAMGSSKGKKKSGHHLCSFLTCSVRPREAATGLACVQMQDAQLPKTAARQHTPACAPFGSPPGTQAHVLEVSKVGCIVVILKDAFLEGVKP